MTLYDINAQLEALLEQVDPETGELVTPGVVYAEGYDASNFVYFQF